MTTNYNSNFNETIPFSDTCYQICCAANTSQVITVEGGDDTKYQAYFQYSDESNVFVRLNSEPTVPSSGSISDEQYNEFKPEKRYVKKGDKIYVISPNDNVYVGVSLRKL